MISESLFISLLSLAGTLLGSFAGILTSSKLSNYRIEQLEKKVEKHNNLVERMYKVEENDEVTEEKIKVINHRISDLEKINTYNRKESN